MVNLEGLKIEKERLGSLELVDLSELSLEESYRELGRQVRDAARKSVDTLIDEDDPSVFRVDLEFADKCLSVIEDRIKHEENPLIKGGLEAYLKAIKSWSDEIDFSSLEHRQISELLGDIYERDKLNLLIALSLQNDNVGCISGLLRGESGEVIFWHNEEDVEDEPGSRVDKTRIVKIKGVRGSEYFSFVYPDLLPGAGFTFGKDLFLCVDMQHTKEDQEPAILANTAVWTASYIGNGMHPYDIMRALAPFADGYVVNYARRGEVGIEAGKVEFALDTVDKIELESKAGTRMISTNIYTQNGKVVLEGNENANEEALAWNLQRQALADRALHLMRVLTQREIPTPYDISRLLAFNTGGRYGDDKAFSNVDVKSAIFGVMTVDGTEIKVTAGPALRDEVWTDFNLYN